MADENSMSLFSRGKRLIKAEEDSKDKRYLEKLNVKSVTKKTRRYIIKYLTLDVNQKVLKYFMYLKRVCEDTYSRR